MSERHSPVASGLSGPNPGDADPYFTQAATAHLSARGLSSSPSVSAVASEAEELEQLEFDLLTQTSLIVSQVRDQLADVSRREQSLLSQQAAIESERRAFRIERQQFETLKAENSEQLEVRERALSFEQDLLQQQSAEAAQLRADLQQQREQFAAEQLAQRAQLVTELAQERLELRASLAAVETQRALIETDRDDFERQKLGLTQELDRQREELSTALTFEHARMKEEVTEAQISDQLRSDREQLRTERERFQQSVDEWYREKTDAEAELRQQRDKLDAERQRAELELNELRQRAWEESDQLRIEHDRRLQAERQQLIDEQQHVEIELRKQQALLESRTRFQQDHLTRSREEVERAQDVFRVEYQRSRQRLESLVEVQRRQARHIERRRAIVEEYGESVRRQQDTLSRLQSSLEASAANERQRLATDRQAWELKVQTQWSENRRQSDMITLHAENLEARRLRLDRLREDLEEKHRGLLETQMAVDEGWAQLGQVTGDENAAVRVEKARETLSDYYRMLRDGLQSQTREFDEQRQLFEQQKSEFRSEQQSFTDWIAQREQHLRRQEEQLQTQLAQLTDQEASWQRARDVWLTERLEAERIIRQLLSELSTSIDAASGTRNSDLPAMPNLLGLSRFLDNAA